MSGKVLGIVEAKDGGGVSITLGIDQVSRKGEANKKTTDILAGHSSMASLTKQLKSGLERNTPRDVAETIGKGKAEDVIGDLHMSLAKAQCGCGSENYLVFERALVSAIGSGLLSNTYNTRVTYRCPNCGETLSAEGIFKKWGWGRT